MKFAKQSDIRIVYMGTPEISAKVLEALLAASFNIVAVIANEDKPVGRKKVLEPVPTKRVALSKGIPVYQPHRIRLENDFLKEIKPDLIITMAYGQIVPNEVLSCPKYGCLNLHGSLLPEYRGAAPMQRCLIDGKSKTGVTLMEMVAAMDAGRMYAKKEIELTEEDNYGSLADKMVSAASSLMIDSLLPYLNGELEGENQNESEVTFADKIKPEDEHLDLSLGAEKLSNWVRALSPAPGAYVLLNGKKLKILSAARFEGEYDCPDGSLLIEGKKLLLISQKTALEIKTVQMEGKKPMDCISFLNGYRAVLLGAKAE